jgi:flagellar biosynthetic protein FliQ
VERRPGADSNSVSADFRFSVRPRDQKKEDNMDSASAIDFARSAIIVLLEMIAPAMITALVVGLGIGLLQALTQIQEQTLVFVPKIVAVFIVLLIFLPFAGSALGSLMTDIAARIAAY